MKPLTDFSDKLAEKTVRQSGVGLAMKADDATRAAIAALYGPVK